MMLLDGSTAEYVWAAAVTAWRFRQVSRHGVHLMVTPKIGPLVRPLLSPLFDSIIAIEYVAHPAGKGGPYKGNYTKLAVFDLVQFDRILYSDIDMLPLQSVDDLFDLDVPFAAALDGYSRRRNYFNSGVMLLEPDRNVYVEMRSAYMKNSRDRGFAEQDFLNWWFRPRFFPRCLKRGNWHVLPYADNATHYRRHLDLGHPDGRVRMIHEKLWADHGLERYQGMWWVALDEAVAHLTQTGVTIASSPFAVPERSTEKG
jgi:alpha-N-acetylglucosamine transferase